MQNKSCLSGRLDVKAFTLIELLVVVLIIGILAAVALPQYQKAVEKSRATQAITLLKSIGEAGEVYHLANGEWPTNFEELSVEVPNWSGRTAWTNLTPEDIRSNDDWSLEIQQNSRQFFAMMWRISGKYAGAGFVYRWQDDPEIPLNQVICVERTQNGGKFQGNAGDFCEKIIRGTLVGGTHNRYYSLP